MKKLFLGAITAMAFIFGVVSCSDALHDVVENPYVPGGSDEDGTASGSAWIAGEPTGGAFKEMTIENGQFTYSFTYDANAAWGGAEGESHFTICSADDYDIYKDGGYRWQSKVEATPDKTGELAAYEYDNHCIVSGLTKGRTYKIVASLTTTGGSLSVSEIAVPDYKYLYGYFARGNFNDWGADAGYLMAEPFDKSVETGDVVYKIEFTAPEDGEAEFGIANGDWSAKYVGAIIAFPSEKDISDAVNMTYNGDENNTVTGLAGGKPYYAVVTSKLDGTVTLAIEAIKYIDVVGCKVINYEDDEGPIYFLEAWIPGNDWGVKNPHANVVDGTATVTFEKPVRITADSIVLQMVSFKDGADESGFWSIKVGGGSQTIENPKNFQRGYLVFDCSESELAFVTEE
ncbi:MAG: hypothetical protein HDR51_03615 [Treponema sp.]|nr:hypothetical protein [Treponema sp.]